MENDELIKRMEDLSDRCERSSILTSSGFLTPAEQAAVEEWARYTRKTNLHLFGGREYCERRAAFFLPYYMEQEDFNPAEYICAVKIQSFFGTPEHRDYMGSILGLGIKREWVGDIFVKESAAYVFCLPSVEGLLLSDLSKVRHCGVKTQRCSLDDVPVPIRKVREISFTVKSMRLDAVTAGMFSLSRTSAAEFIRLGAATLNHIQCMNTDASVKEGDIISLRGKGKGSIKECGGTSKKGRLFVTGEVLQ